MPADIIQWYKRDEIPERFHFNDNVVRFVVFNVSVLGNLGKLLIWRIYVIRSSWSMQEIITVRRPVSDLMTVKFHAILVAATKSCETRTFVLSLEVYDDVCDCTE